MRKIIISVIIILLVIGGYVFIRDRQIKSELSKVEEAQETNQNATSTKKVVASEIAITRTAGVWSVTNTGEYTIDPKSLIFEFTGYKPGGEHVGTFNNIKADIALDAEGKPISSVLSMDIASVKTDTEAVDKHLQTADFFDVASNPGISVIISDLTKENDTTAKAVTSITMKGVTKTLSIPVTLTPVNGGVKFNVDTRINISDFGIAYGPVLNEVRVKVEGVLLKK